MSKIRQVDFVEVQLRGKLLFAVAGITIGKKGDYGN
jgi:hypothetical protein